ncbi:heavy metal translocating P-type ATPase [Clostridium algidicarnis]|uniref:heavy metal translocating P-type ATPase n=1 Tax=Clostridium algidicarnis TaxID=37659 RepID=UPI001C0B3232|nr:heavy metal translocating P-type ATPase [Clostridium algidicarnis]MBU3194381.1 cadmium-translocating P-type ATPase [Clostridium algidicarnis]
MIKHELILEGLDCANCSAKIEDKVSKIEDVFSASMNFSTKTLIIESNKEEAMDKILKESIDIINRLEPDVIVRQKEKNLGQNKNMIIMLEGLNCANCAAKIETEVNKLEEIKEAGLDFVSKRLIIKVDNNSNRNNIFSKVQSIVNKLEPEVEVKLQSNNSINNKDLDINTKSENEQENNEIKESIIKLILGLGFFIIPLIFDFSPKIELGLFLISYALVGGEIVLRAVKNISKGQVFDENFLMTIATLGAFAIRQYPEAVAVMIFYQVGELFQDIAVNKSRKSISDLMDIRPDSANVKRGEEFITVSPQEVLIGDIIMIKPGEKLPLDGVIIEGKSMVDTSALTGESVPRTVRTGDEVLGGFINKNGLLYVKVEKEFGESTLSKILDLVQNAGAKKAPTEKFITKFARYYTPVVVISAVMLAVVPPLIIEGATFSDWIYRALVFLVVSCPCALVVSIPLGFFGGIGSASKNGILIKGGNYLEALNKVETIVFDKTGTLTKGVFKVTNVYSKEGFTKESLIEYAAYVEAFSTHPIATSIVEYFDKDIDKSRVKNYEEISGHGIKALVDNKNVLAGNKKLMDMHNIEVEEISSIGTVVYLSIDEGYAGHVDISDEIKEDSKEAIIGLKASGIKNILMVTGDNKVVADKVGTKIGVDKVYSELLPQNKVEILEGLQEDKLRKGKVAFVGDGINDAPVLARADIGIAMGGVGSDAAIEAADVVIMTDEPSKIILAIKIAKKTNKVVWQNIIFALSVKLVILILGAMGIATMWEAVFGDVGVALIAVLNSMRVLRVKN